ncbi:MAG: relaxase domain-containing protein [Opitutae bacterium]|nr:relaxase domain-containing protein [Opitutae bacterium]
MAKIKDGGTYLAQHLSANDYYCENEKVTGLWQGRAAERLGLHGEIHADDAAFENLRHNRYPDGQGKLTARDGHDRVRFFDFQCSAQKSVSIMAVTMGDTRLLVAHDRAAVVAFGELEKFAACQANTVFQRNNRITGNVVAATFRHTASRALDPQVHTHFVVANATWDKATKSWKALTEFEMVRAIRYAGKTYQNELAKECRQLGYEITPARDARGTVTGFEIAGVSEDVRTRFSKRRAEVERGIAAFETKNGRTPTTAEVHAITVESRNAKLAEVTTPAVLAAQKGQLMPAEWAELSALKAQALAQGDPESIPTRERESLRLSVGHLYERRSVVVGHEVLAEALNQNLGYVELGRLHAQAAKGGLVALDEKPWLHGSFATPRGLAQERWAVEFIGRTNGTFPELGHADQSALAHLSPEQRRAVAEVLGSRDQVVCLRGAAGVGKTTVLKVMHDALVADGRQVLTCAPTSSAADTLRHDDMTNATTVANLLQNVAPRDIRQGTVLIVDEAGLASNQQGAELLQLAERNGARVVVLGDSRQHTSVEAGDFLRILETHAPIYRVELTDVRRQTVKEYRDAVRLMAAGSARDGLEQLDGMGWLHECKAEYLRSAVGDYLRVSDNGQRLDRVLAVTPTWEENHAFTALLRNELKAHGTLGAGETLISHDPLPWTKAQLGRAASYTPGLVVTFNRSGDGFKRGEFAPVVRVEAGQVWVAGRTGEQALPLRGGNFSVAKVQPMEVCPGDKLLVRANDRAAKLINGQTLNVTAVKDGIIHTTEGRKIDTGKFRQFGYGFAVTSHRSQSKTTDHVVVAAARLDAKAAYVACSRGRLSCSVHTPDKVALLERLPQGTRPAGLDFQPLAAGLARTEAWARLDRHVPGTEDRPDPAVSALAHPWWRGIMHGVAEWGRKAMPGHPVDRAAEVRIHNQTR